MAGPLLETKFHVPAARGPRVHRSRLSTQLERAIGSPLTLVSAPAGFGKTTVMAELATGARERAAVAWLSLDPTDNDPRTFWTYVVGALDRAVPGLAGAAGSMLGASEAAVDGALATILNAAAAHSTHILLVLDDLHAIDDPSVHSQLASVLDRAPAQLHVVVGTRADPPLPLARLRARGELVEIRAADLRFTIDEAAAYLGEVMGLSLTETNVAALESRTEGWIAALQLAALSMQGREDVGAFIASFAGDDRYIVDYLVDEVLRRQPPAVRTFLLQTSILSRLTGPLCDAVTGQPGGSATLESLDRANLFVIALDDQRRWYRYHHLFGGVLQADLRMEAADRVPELHRLASEWLESNGDAPEAIRHALEGGDVQRAADLVERAMPEMRRLRREPVLRRWLGALPDEVLQARPVLCSGYAGTLLSLQEPDRVRQLLEWAEAWVSGVASASAAVGMVVADRAEFERLPVAIELSRAALAKMEGDLPGNVEHARRVLEMVGSSDPLAHGGAAAFLGLAYWGMGDLHEGYRWYAEGMASLEKVGHLTDVVGGMIVLADIDLAQGRLGAARRLYERGLRIATAPGGPVLRGAADMHTGFAEVAYERGELDAARAHLDEQRRLGDEHAFPRDPYRSRVVDARLRQAAGDVEGAILLLDEAATLYVSDYSPDVRPIAAIRAGIQVSHGRTADARRWASERDLSPTTEVSYVREFELLTYARLLVGETIANGAGGGIAGALDLIARLRAAAGAGGRDGSMLRILIVEALARRAAGEMEGALSALAGAVELAEPEGYVRAFLDEGPPMVGLLRVAARQRGAAPYVQRLLDAIDASSQGTTARQPLAEPLSERELEVLRLLQGDLDGPGLAAELYVSVNTLRTHTKNIYAKLGVTSRRAAVRRAAELDLLSRGSDRGSAT